MTAQDVTKWTVLELLFQQNLEKGMSVFDALTAAATEYEMFKEEPVND